MKRCITCDYVKTDGEYYGSRNECCECKIRRTLRHRKENPELHRRYAKNQQAIFKGLTL